MSGTLTKKIPVLDLSPEISELWDEFNAAFQRVMKNGQFIMGPEVAAFEAEVAAYLGTEHAIGVNSGTDALVLALRALGVGSGHEVITTPFSFFATAESISNVGATPVFVDIDEESLNMDPSLIEAAITPNTRALMPVHIYGRPVEMDGVMEIANRHGLKVVEDCAQSFGARHNGKQTGTIGHIGAYSFFPTKNLGAFGDGGLIVTDDAALADQARMLRAHGSRKKYQNEVLGYNSRLDAMQAAFLRVKLPRVDAWNDRRRKVAATYNRLLEGVPGVVTPAVTTGHVFHQYTVRLLHANREAVQAELQAAGVATMVYYPIPQDQLPVYQGAYEPKPIASQAATQVLSLPIGPNVSEEDQGYVVQALKTALKRG